MNDNEDKKKKKKPEPVLLIKLAAIWCAVSAVLAAVFALCSGMGFKNGFYTWFVIFLLFGGMALAYELLKWMLQKLFPEHFDTPEHAGKTMALLIRNVLILCGFLYILERLVGYVYK